MHLVCRQCATRFTPELQLVPFETRNETIEEDFLPPGGLMQSESSFYFDDNVGNFIANIADTQNMKLTSDITRLYGCCGPGGGHGPNLQCEICGTYVATKVEDCCTPHYIFFDPSTTQAAMSEGE
ncbi:hypothetical protein [Granulicella sp. dw_53]|uniref:hypothetical protein n=1 Tax=Granulicella sp. dw_53 TaxID=2719792 RepID=UPI001BD202E0|nr:hypothetical protein [Granulicella sp. dw_53]